MPASLPMPPLPLSQGRPQVQVFVDKAAVPIINAEVDLEAAAMDEDGRAFVGFTAASTSGDDAAAHEVTPYAYPLSLPASLPPVPAIPPLSISHVITFATCAAESYMSTSQLLSWQLHHLGV